MKIEILLIIFWVLILIIWATWLRLSTWYHNRRYKPENDKGRLAEDERQRLIAAEFTKRTSERGFSGTPTGESRERRFEGFTQSSERSVFPSTASNGVTTNKARSSRLKRLLKGRK